VPALLQTLAHRTDPPIELALATSSHAKNFQLKTNHLQDLFSVFPATQRVLGDDPRIAPGRGKPAPDIWLVALQTINDKRRHEGGEAIRPEECLVFEDSVPGTESARRAGMQVVWCPHPGLLQEYAGREEQVLAGQMGELKGESAVVGEVGDGWARLVKSLEELPYEEYGIGVKGGSQL
jgi:pseudouridine-5'-monophosphatase